MQGLVGGAGRVGVRAALKRALRPPGGGGRSRAQHGAIAVSRVGSARCCACESISCAPPAAARPSESPSLPSPESRLGAPLRRPAAAVGPFFRAECRDGRLFCLAQTQAGNCNGPDASVCREHASTDGRCSLLPRWHASLACCPPCPLSASAGTPPRRGPSKINCKARGAPPHARRLQRALPSLQRDTAAVMARRGGRGGTVTARARALKWSDRCAIRRAPPSHPRPTSPVFKRCQRAQRCRVL